jgi:rhodanese-related sulfurtransferase
MSLLIDLRPAHLRAAQPLEGRTPHALRVVSLEEIEAGHHGLRPADGPLLLVCERGVRSSLAARYLRADGLEAEHVTGGVATLLDHSD